VNAPSSRRSRNGRPAWCFFDAANVASVVWPMFTAASNVRAMFAIISAF
jgi:hypothetical protein